MDKKTILAAISALVIVVLIGIVVMNVYNNSKLSQNEILLNSGEYQAVVDNLRSSVTGNSGSTNERIIVATALYRLGNYDEALEVLQPLTEYRNLHPEAVSIAGWIAVDQNSPIRAQERFNQLETLGQKGKAEAGFAAIALLRSDGYRSKEIEQADIHLLNAKSDAISTPEFHVTQGRLLLYRHQYADAIQNAEQAAAKAPNWFEPYLLLGRAYLENGQSDKAKEAFQLALNNGAPEEETKFYLARSTYYEGEFDEAITLYNELLVFEGEIQRRALEDQAKIFILLQEHEKAISALQKAISIKLLPTNGLQLYQVYSRLKQEEPAQTILARVIANYPYITQSLMEKGHSDFKSNQLQQAYTNYQAALDNADNAFLALYNIGCLSMIRGDYFQAPNFFESATRINDAYLPARINHTLSLLAIDREREAQPLLQELDSEYPNNNAIQRVRALERFLAGYSDIAIQFLEKNNPDEENNASAFMIQGNIYLRLFQFEQAQAQLEKAVSLEPNNYRAKVSLAHVYYRLGLSDQALLLYEEIKNADAVLTPLIKLEVDNGLAMIYLDQGDSESAHQIWHNLRDAGELGRQISRINAALDNEQIPTSEDIELLESATLESNVLPESYYNLALFHERMNNDQRAHESYEILLAQFQTYLPGLFNFAEWNRTRGRIEEAVYYYNKATDVAPDRIDILNNAAVAQVIRENYDQAEHLLSRALEIDPNSPNVIANLAYVAIKSQDLNKAKRHLQQLKDMGASANHVSMVQSLIYGFENNWLDMQSLLEQFRRQIGDQPYAILNLGIALAKQSNFQQAEQYLKRAVTLQNTNPDTHRALGLLYCQMGLYEEAEHALSTSFSLDPTQQDLEAILNQITHWLRG